VPAAFVAGLLIAPAMTAVTLLVSKYAPAQYATESFTWSSTAIVTGIGIGTAFAGTVVERYGASNAFLFAGACAMVGAAIAITLRRAAVLQV